MKSSSLFCVYFFVQNLWIFLLCLIYVVALHQYSFFHEKSLISEGMCSMNFALFMDACIHLLFIKIHAHLNPFLPSQPDSVVRFFFINFYIRNMLNNDWITRRFVIRLSNQVYVYISRGIFL